MNAPAIARCPRCHQTLSLATLQGLCPDCLALVAFDRSPDSGGTAADVGPDQPERSGQALSPSVRYVGDYELLAEIGRGGMGVVYRARQVSLNREVAVKMILAGQFAGSAQKARFRREAEAAAQLRHPNIVAIHEVGEFEGRSYFSMDYIEGPTLAARLKQGPITPAEAAKLVRVLAEAVHYAHQRGTLHRDLKPQNVLLSGDGQPHILDFGLARPIEGGADLTHSGDVVGSPNYMPPEQALGRGAEVGPASDVYALGAILYEALTGRAPFVGSTVTDVLRQVVDLNPEAPRRRRPDLPADLETICLKCLEKTPDRRYHSARMLAEELERFLNFEPILARPASRTRRTWSWFQQNPWALAAGCGMLALVCLGAAYGLWERARFLQWRLEVGQAAPLPAGDSPAVLFLALLPGLCFLVYFSSNAFRKSYRRRLEKGTPISTSQLLWHGVFGVLGTKAGLGYVLWQVRSWIWLPFNPPFLALELVSVPCALLLCALGIRMVWEALGMHETSRFRGVVDRSLERQLAGESRSWSVLKLIGFALWLLLGACGFLVLLAGLAVHASPQALGIVAGGVLLSVAVSARLVGVIRQRRRLFTHVCVPLALFLFAFALGVLMLDPGLVAGLFGCSVLSALLTASGMVFFLGGAPARDGQARRFPGNPWLDLAGGIALCLGLVALLYVVENWRGRRAWTQVLAEAAARGESLAYSPAHKEPLPDDQNVMAHPYMKRYFVKGGETFPVPHPRARVGNSPFAFAWLKGLPARSEPAAHVTGLVGEPAGAEPLALLQFTNQPLGEVVTNLALQAGLRFRGPTNQWLLMEHRDRAWRPQRVTRTFTNTTALAALDRLLEEHLLAPDPAIWREQRMLALKEEAGPFSLHEIVAGYGRHREDLAQLETALQRPGSRLTGDPRHLLEMPIPNFVSFRQAAQVYINLCRVHLLLGDPEAAWHDVSTLRRLMRAELANEPDTLVGAMIHVAIADLLAQTLEESLAAQLWPEPYLQPLRTLLGDLDLLQTVSVAMREGERNALLAWFRLQARDNAAQLFNLFDLRDGKDPSLIRSALAAIIPQGWIDQNCASLVRLHLDCVEGLDPVRRRIDARAVEGGFGRVEQMLEGRVFRPYYYLAAIAIPNFAKAYQSMARVQTKLDQVRVACALEQFRARQGSYPETLDALVPAPLAALPHDLFDGQPPRYRRLTADKYLLYSIGWNATDDQGRTRRDGDGRPQWREDLGDWVWAGVPDDARSR